MEVLFLLGCSISIRFLAHQVLFFFPIKIKMSDPGESSAMPTLQMLLHEVCFMLAVCDKWLWALQLSSSRQSEDYLLLFQHVSLSGFWFLFSVNTGTGLLGCV